MLFDCVFFIMSLFWAIWELFLLLEKKNTSFFLHLEQDTKDIL